MNSLTTQPLAPLLAQLFAAADVQKAKMKQEMEKWTPEQRDAFMRHGDYRELYTRMRDIPLSVSRNTGVLLYMLARSTGARSIIEFGTSFGISTLHLAAALRDNGGGHLISTEFVPSKVVRARENIMKANLSNIVEIPEGDALETLARDLPEMIDLVLLDGAKELYPRILSLLDAHLRAGALIIADDADHSPDYLAKVRSATGGYFSVPFTNDVELSMKLCVFM